MKSMHWRLGLLAVLIVYHLIQGNGTTQASVPDAEAYKYSKFDAKGAYTTPEHDPRFSGLFDTYEPPDDYTKEQARIAMDSFKRASEERRMSNTFFMGSSQGSYLGTLATGGGKYFYGIGNVYYRSTFDKAFHINDSNFIAKLKWEGNSGTYVREYVKGNYQSSNQMMYFPISTVTYAISMVLSSITTLFGIVGLLFCLFYLPIKVLQDVSQGKIVTEDNIIRFNTMSLLSLWCLLLMMAVCLFQTLMMLPFKSNFISWPGDSGLMIRVAIYHLVVTAFRMGMLKIFKYPGVPEPA